MGLLAEGMTVWDWLHANMTLIASGVFLTFTVITGAIGWYFREVWKAEKDRKDKLALNEIDRANRKALKEETLLEVLIDHFPKQSETLESMKECAIEGRRRDSDFVRVLAGIMDGLDNVAIAVVAGSCPERADLAAAHLREHLQRVEKRKTRPDAPPGFLDKTK